MKKMHTNYVLVQGAHENLVKFTRERSVTRLTTPLTMRNSEAITLTCGIAFRSASELEWTFQSLDKVDTWLLYLLCKKHALCMKLVSLNIRRYPNEEAQVTDITIDHECGDFRDAKVTAAAYFERFYHMKNIQFIVAVLSNTHKIDGSLECGVVCDGQIWDLVVRMNGTSDNIDRIYHQAQWMSSLDRSLKVLKRDHQVLIGIPHPFSC